MGRSGGVLGVDAVRVGVSRVVETVGDAAGGSLRHLAFSSSSCVLQPCSRSPGLGGGCHAAVVGQSSGLRLPSVFSPLSGAGEVEGVEGHVHGSGGSPMASVGVVSRPPCTLDCSSQTSPVLVVSSSAASVREASREPPRAQSSWVATLQCLLRARGFSGRAAHRILKPQR